MERLIIDFLMAVAFFIIAFSLYLISKFSRKLFKGWSKEDKSTIVSISIFAIIVLAIISSFVGGIAENILSGIAFIIVIFIILVATSNIDNKNK